MKTTPDRENPLFHNVHPEAAGKTAAAYDAGAEKHILKFSLYCALFFAVLGLAWGLLIRSQMLVFDGIYAFASVLMTGVSVYIAGLMKNKDDAKFPFGRSQMEPMVIILKSLVIIVICLNASIRAVAVMISGGREINVFSAMVYSIVGIIGCLGCWLHIRRLREKAQCSEFVRDYSMQWLSDIIISVMMFFGFFTAYRIGQGQHAYYARYIDQLMVIVSAVFISAVPFVSFARGIKDMLCMAPDGEVYRVSRQVLDDIAKKQGFDGFVLRIVKSGRELFYEIGFVSDNPDYARPIAEFDGIREEVEDRLKALCQNPIWLDVSFMHDKKWV